MNAVRSAAVLLLMLAASVTRPAIAQTQADPTPSQLERRGRYEEAAVGFKAILDAEPGNVTALLGLERVLVNRLDQTAEMLRYIARAIEASPLHEQIREVDFRVAASEFGADSAEAAFRRWGDAMPLSAAPYRLYAFWLGGQGDLEGALAVLDRGDERIGNARIAQYRAQILIMAGDWLASASHWRRAVDLDPAYAQAAGSSLSRTPVEYRDVILQTVLGIRPTTSAQLLSADLLVRWGRPEEGWTLLDRALPPNDVQAAALLRRFADRAGQLRTLSGARARGYALERLSERQTGAEASRTRVAAARAFADAGELEAAQRLLNRSRTRGSETDDAVAAATLIRVLADAGQLAEAEVRFFEWETRLRGDDVDDLRQRIAWGWILQPKLDRAAAVLAKDSSVTGQAVRGWIALYRGELATAKEHFAAAGPSSQSREEATRRASMLVLLQRIQAQSSPPLGEALLRAARGDTTEAVEQLEAVATTFPATAGRAEVLVYAGRLLSRQSDYENAVRVLGVAFHADSAGPSAPAAELALAVALVKLGRPQEAMPRLEHLILTYQESALVPQARRLFDQINGMIPKS